MAPGVWIDEAEFEFTASRSGGPGGQNVNKVNTRVTLRFDLAGSTAFSPSQKAALMAAYPGRISEKGVFWVVSQRFRTQAANRRAAMERFRELVAAALRPRPRRRPTRPTRSSVTRRLDAKRRRGERKQDRSSRFGPAD
ncbi:MAG: aminoacyl-tRNA hydrolase [Phycisphaerae bacterium]|nr:aminoacyl-tRNA hydrolase [Phycisphaerae bacterium]